MHVTGGRHGASLPPEPCWAAFGCNTLSADRAIAIASIWPNATTRALHPSAIGAIECIRTLRPLVLAVFRLGSNATEWRQMPGQLTQSLLDQADKLGGYE